MSAETGCVGAGTGGKKNKAKQHLVISTNMRTCEAPDYQTKIPTKATEMILKRTSNHTNRIKKKKNKKIKTYRKQRGMKSEQVLNWTQSDSDPPFPF